MIIIFLHLLYPVVRIGYIKTFYYILLYLYSIRKTILKLIFFTTVHGQTLVTINFNLSYNPRISILVTLSTHLSHFGETSINNTPNFSCQFFHISYRLFYISSLLQSNSMLNLLISLYSCIHFLKEIINRNKSV